MQRETVNLLILVLFILYVFSILIVSFLNNKDMERAKNGSIRFFNRLRLLWPVHLFFIFLFLSLILANYAFHDLRIESYLISFGGLVITVYFLDFLYSEQTRKETANKRYIIDAEIDKVIQDFQFGIADLFFNDKPNENGLYDSTRIYQLDENEIHIMITSPLFWETELNLKHVKGFDYLLNKNDFLNRLLDGKREDLNNILMKYSNLTLYEDFKRIHALDELIQSFYFKQGSQFHQMNQLMIANQLETLIRFINDGLHVFGKWK